MVSFAKTLTLLGQTFLIVCALINFSSNGAINSLIRFLLMSFLIQVSSVSFVKINGILFFNFWQVILKQDKHHLEQTLTNHTNYVLKIETISLRVGEQEIRNV